VVASVKIEPQVVERFLKTGAVTGYSISDLVALCDKHVRASTQASATESISLGRRFVARCRSLDSESLLVALRAAGWAYLVAGQYRQARDSYLAARKIAIRQPLVRARIDRTLIDVFMYLGDPAQARNYASRALATFRRIHADDDLARTNVNYANVLHRQDRHREANSLYHRAAEHFRARGDELSTALCWYNEANTLVQLFDFDLAFKLYTEAREIFQQKGHALHAYGCLYGLAWLHMLKGDFHVALRDLAECEAFYHSGGQHREMILCQLDRAESYLGLNLLSDASRAAGQAAVGARKLGIRYEEAKAAFFAARAAMGLNRLRTAHRQLRLAQGLMKREGNKGFLAAIQVTQALLGQDAAKRQRDFDSARAELHSIQLPLWEAICDIEIAVEQHDKSVALRRLARNRAVKTVPHLQAQYGLLRGDQAAEHGRSGEATKWWTRSAEVLDAVRSILPPIEMRSAFLQGRRDPFKRLVQAEAERDPRKAAVWVERSKTVGIWSPLDLSLADNPARIRVQRSMSELAQHVAAVSSLTASGTGRRSARLAYSLPILARLRETVRQELLALYAENGAHPENPEFTLELLASVADELPIVQFHVGDRDLQAFISHRGECRAHTYIDGVRKLDDFVARWRFFVESAPSSVVDHRPVDIADETELLQRISSWLLDPLALPADSERILIIPEDKLFCLPWPALRWHGEPMYENVALIQAPSVRHYLHSRRSITKSQRANIFVGDTSGLPWLRDEVELVKHRLKGMTIEVHDPCRRQDWPESSSARIWHFAGHALLRSDNPFYSALLLKDEQIFAADFRLKKNDVDVVTLAACRTGQQSGLPGEESSGLVRAMLEMGARSVVAGGWAVADRSTSVWMDSFYAALMRNDSPLTAMTRAIRAVRKDYPSAYHWAAFTVYGAG
jgi:tetratricopeptide (TPR) repeat protein